MIKQQPSFISKRRHPKELPLFLFVAILSIVLFFAALYVSITYDEYIESYRLNSLEHYRLTHPGMVHLSDQEAMDALYETTDDNLLMVIRYLDTPWLIAAPFGLAAFIVLIFGYTYGEVHANSVRVTQKQFPILYKHWTELAHKMDMPQIPNLYLKNGNGMLNAYATCVPGYRNYGVVYSDIVQTALQGGDVVALRFILGHELGHIKLNHIKPWYAALTMLGNLPGISYVLGLPLSRAREYSCDKIGHHFAQDHQCRGLMMLAAGKYFNEEVDLEQYVDHHIRKQSFWATVYNFFGNHPNINWRIAAIINRRHGPLLFGTLNRQVHDDQAVNAKVASNTVQKVK